MEKGAIKYIGEVSGAIDHYDRSFNRAETKASNPAQRPGTGEYRIVAISPTKEFYETTEEKVIQFALERRKAFVGKIFVSCHIVDAHGGILLQCDSRMVGFWIDSVDTYEGQFSLRTPWLKPGSYRVDMFVCSSGILDRYEEACHLEIMPLLPYPQADNPEATSGGIIFGDFNYEKIPAAAAKTI
jgi:lipopolysaccharide transport system ATP-binding protein